MRSTHRPQTSFEANCVRGLVAPEPDGCCAAGSGVTFYFCENLCVLCGKLVCLFSKPTDWLTRQINPHALHLRVEFQRVLAHLASVP